MTQERERILQKIKRVQALAERGVAGEQESAAATLDRLMKQCFGRKYVTAADLESFRIRFNGAVLFLDYTHQIEGRWIRGADCNMEKWRETGNEKRETAPTESDGPRHAADSIQP